MKTKRFWNILTINIMISSTIAFIYGMMGIRMLLMAYFPLTLYDICVDLIKARKKEMTAASIFVFISFIGSLSGFLFFNFYWKDKFYFGQVPSDMYFISSDRIVERVGVTLGGFFGIAGAEGRVKVLSIRGMAYAVSFLNLFIVLIGSFFGRKQKGYQVVIDILGLSLFMTAVTLTFIDWKNMSRYYVIYALLTSIVYACIYDKAIRFRPYYLLLILMVGSLNVMGNIFPKTKEKIDPSNDWEIIRWCEDNQLYNGFGSLCGLSIGPRSNFDVNLGYIIFDSENGKFQITTSMSSELPYLSDEPSFVMIPVNEYENNQEKMEKTILSEAVKKTEIGSYMLFGFDHNPMLEDMETLMK